MDTQTHPPPSRNTQSSPPCLGDAKRLPVGPEPWPGATGTELCRANLSFWSALRGRIILQLRDRGQHPGSSPGRPRAVLVQVLAQGFPERPLGNPAALPWGCPPPGSIPEWKGPCILSIWGVPWPRSSPGWGLASPPAPKWDRADTLTCGCWAESWRPSRNQVTCGRRKLEMRGARMTAASPWGGGSGASRPPRSSHVCGRGRAHGGSATRRSATETARLLGGEWWERKKLQGRHRVATGERAVLDTLTRPHHPLPHGGVLRLVLLGFTCHLRLYVHESVDSFNSRSS